MSNNNRVVHFEIGAEDPEKLSEFYRSAFGWKINEWPGSNYWLTGSEEDRAIGAINGGIMERFNQERTIINIETDNIEVTLADVEKHGGKVVKPLKDTPLGPDETMRWCYCEDPQGNVFGLMQMIPTKG